MSESLTDDHGSNDRLPNILSEFEQQLREAPTCAGPTAQRRDRLMYDSGYAASQSQFEVQWQAQTNHNRRSLVHWKFVSLAMSVLLVASVGFHVFYGPSRPALLAVAPETTDEPTLRATEPSSPLIWPGMAPVVAQSIPDPDDPYRVPYQVISVRSHWTAYEPAPQPTPLPQNAPPADPVEPPLRASDYRRLLDRT